MAPKSDGGRAQAAQAPAPARARRPPMPEEASKWSKRERDIWVLTSGMFHPRRLLRDSAAGDSPHERGNAGQPGRVSMITPTTESRHEFHRQLWECFLAQDWPDKELVVVETCTRRPSAFLTEKARQDPRLVYQAFRRRPKEDWSIGLKRNLCVHLASGEFILHFDDDDLYASSYTPRMMEEFHRRKAQAVKLSTWYTVDVATGVFGYCDPRNVCRGLKEEGEVARQRIYGYGFSYAYTRQASFDFPFDDMNIGEDFRFLDTLHRKGGPGAVHLMPDTTGLALHTQHGHNTSESSCVRLREVQWAEVSDLEVADLYPVFDNYLRILRDSAAVKAAMKGQEVAWHTGRMAGRGFSGPQKRWSRDVMAHMPGGKFKISCPVGATAAEFLEILEHQVGTLPIATNVYWAKPVTGLGNPELQSILAIRAARIISPSAPPAEDFLYQWQEGELEPEQEKLLAYARGAVPLHCRIGGRTSELWVVPPNLQEGSATVSCRVSPSVRVTLKDSPESGSLNRIFHVALPLTATVSDLRKALAPRLSDWADVMARKPGKGEVRLRDAEPVPDKVMVSDYSGKIGDEWVLTKEQAIELQRLLIVHLRRPETQGMFQRWMREVKGNEPAYRMHLATYLRNELYPEYASRFGLPYSSSSMKPMLWSLRLHVEGDFTGHRQGVELEILMRNTEMMWSALGGFARAVSQVYSIPYEYVNHNDLLGKLLHECNAETWLAALETVRARPALVVEGAKGEDVEIVNGVYDMQEGGEGWTYTGQESPCYRRRRSKRAAEEEGGEDVWLFRAENMTWCIAPASAYGVKHNPCWAFSMASPPGVLPWDALGWQLAVGDNWEAQELQVAGTRHGSQRLAEKSSRTARTTVSHLGAIFQAPQGSLPRTEFGYSGGAVLPLIDAFHGKDIKWISSSHEQCSGHSAAAYAKSTGKPGVSIVTSGPGVTNLVTPLQDALTDGVPLVVFSGQVPTSAMGTDAFQECPATEITRPCTKWNYVCLDFNQLPWAVNEAFRIATSGRPGPCHIDLPKDIVSTKAQVPAAVFRKSALSLTDAPPMMDMKCIQKAADLLNRAKRPILYVGQGASHCPELVRKLAAKADVPVTTTVHGMGIFDEREPLSMHMLGMHGAAYANFAIQNADCIVAIGSRFDDRTTGIMDKYAPKARMAEKEGTGGIIHINIDKATFGKVVQPTVAIWADAEHALQAMEGLIKPSEDPSREEWKKQCLQWKKDHAFGYVKAPNGMIKTQQVIEATNAFLHQKGWMDDREVFIATGVGNHQMMAAQFVRWTRPRSMITSGSLGVMGAGLPFAIGAQVANPKSLTILIDGDGSFNMTNMDLQTIKRYNLPVKIAVMNDDRQQMVWIWQRLFFDGRYMSVDNVNPDFVQLARAHGIEAERCSTEEELPGMVEKWLSHDGPMLMEFKVVPDICLPMVAPGKALDEMILLQDRETVFGTSDEELGEMKFEGLAPS